MANAGIKSSQAGTAMRTMFTSLTGEVTFVGDAFGELTVQTTNTDGSMRSLGEILADCRVAFSQMSESEQAANAEALVGKNAMSGFLAVMNAASADIEKLNSAINNFYEIQSRCTKHCWIVQKLFNDRYPVRIYHKHTKGMPYYHRHGHANTVLSAVRQIKSHDVWQLNGRPAMA